MKTYCQTKGKKVFNWRKFLTKEKFSENDWIIADVKANEWPTSPTGGLSELLPRYERGNLNYLEGTPYDSILIECEEQFSRAISDEDSLSALNILDIIELRAKFLIDNNI